jgi:hypothetical protein
MAKLMRQGGLWVTGLRIGKSGGQFRSHWEVRSSKLGKVGIVPQDLSLVTVPCNLPLY